MIVAFVISGFLLLNHRTPKMQTFIDLNGNFSSGSQLYTPITYQAYLGSLDKQVGKTSSGYQVFTDGNNDGIVAILENGKEFLYQKVSQSPVILTSEGVSEVKSGAKTVSNGLTVKSVLSLISSKNEVASPSYTQSSQEISIKLKDKNLYIVFQVLQDVDGNFYLYNPVSYQAYKGNRMLSQFITMEESK